jgi:hypothetical protein
MVYNIGCDYKIYPMFFVLLFNFVKYIRRCISNIEKTSDFFLNVIWDEPIKIVCLKRLNQKQNSKTNYLFNLLTNLPYYLLHVYLKDILAQIQWIWHMGKKLIVWRVMI